MDTCWQKVSNIFILDDLDLVIILGEEALSSSALTAIISILGEPVSCDFVECYLPAIARGLEIYLLDH